MRAYYYVFNYIILISTINSGYNKKGSIDSTIGRKGGIDNIRRRDYNNTSKRDYGNLNFFILISRGSFFTTSL